uniref:Methyl-accepting chemotaxis sensory transducer with Pas/Pac sensor n=1 Tax=Nitratidesulfovibrio vulgaris (strain DSM 19637 / Miyazaki F) TaxID=883 RepID=B8DR25_NITV9
MFSTLSFRTKLIAGSLVMVLVTMAAMLVTSLVDARRGYLAQGRASLRNVSQILMESARFQDTLNRNKIGSDLKLMQLQFGLAGFPIPEIFMEVEADLRDADTGQRVKATLPGFKLGSAYLHQGTDLVDRIRELAGVGASVLQLHEGRLVRVSSSVADPSGSARWTFLGKEHPVTAAVLSGNGFTGMLKVGGQWNLAAYAPVKGMDGSEILGAVEVARPLLTPEFAAAVVRHNVGGKGYSLAFDGAGIILIHPDPAMVGRNVFDLPWGAALKQGDGAQGRNDPAARADTGGSRVLACAINGAEYEACADRYAPWDVIFVTMVSRDELMDGVGERLWRGAAIAAAVALPVAALVIWLMVRQLMVPMQRLATLAQQVARGNFDYTFDYAADDTIGATVRAVQAMVGELRMRLGFSQGVLDGVVVPCVVVDLANDITHVNAEALAVLRRGGAPAQWLGRQLGELVYGSAADAARPVLTRRSMERRDRVAEDVVLDPQADGREVVLHMVATPIYDLDGELMGAISLWVDLTHERAQHARLDAQNAVIAATAREAEDIARRVASSAHELAEQVAHSSEGAARQLARVDEVTAAMDRMNRTVVEVGRRAALAVDMAASTMQVAEDGRDVVRASMDVMHKVHGQVERLQENVAELGREAEGIGQIMGVISDIADQTNLLALNAAIEAARAGEAGRGFAVVADEVRKLAEKTMSATGQVGERIRAIQRATRGFVDSTATVAGAVRESDALATRSGGALDDILARIGDSGGEVRAIAAMAEAQARGGADVERAVAEVDAIARETAQGMAESAHAVTGLSRLAGELQRAMDGMACDGDGATHCDDEESLV